MANEKLAREWIADLRGGEFKQARGALCTDDGHCALGVLSVRISSDKRVKETGWSFDGSAWAKGDAREPGRIPWEVWKAAGFDDGSVPSAGYIAHRQDKNGDKFETIAEYIELALSGALVAELPSGAEQ